MSNLSNADKERWYCPKCDNNLTIDKTTCYGGEDDGYGDSRHTPYTRTPQDKIHCSFNDSLIRNSIDCHINSISRLNDSELIRVKSDISKSPYLQRFIRAKIAYLESKIQEARELLNG